MNKERLIPLIVATALFMENMDSTVIATSLPAIAADIGTSPLTLKLAITSYLLSLAVFIPASGWTADRFGARMVFSLAVAVFMVGSIGCALSSSVTDFVIARIVQGIGGAMMTPVGRLVLLRTIDKSALVNAMAWVTVPALVGPVIGPPLGGFITTYFSWHWIFLINIPIGLLGIFIREVSLGGAGEGAAFVVVPVVPAGRSVQNPNRLAVAGDQDELAALVDLEHEPVPRARRRPTCGAQGPPGGRPHVPVDVQPVRPLDGHDRLLGQLAVVPVDVALPVAAEVEEATCGLGDRVTAGARGQGRLDAGGRLRFDGGRDDCCRGLPGAGRRGACRRAAGRPGACRPGADGRGDRGSRPRGRCRGRARDRQGECGDGGTPQQPCARRRVAPWGAAEGGHGGLPEGQGRLVDGAQRPVPGSPGARLVRCLR